MWKWFKTIMYNNIIKLLDLMQEIKGDFKLALLRSKGFEPLCSMPHVAMLVYVEHNRQAVV